MDRRSRSPESPGRRHRRRRRSRSYSRSRSRDRSRERRRHYSRSGSHDRNYRRGGIGGNGTGGGGSGNSPDLYKDIIDSDYQQNERDKYNRNDRNDRRGRDKDRYYHRGRAHSSESSNDSFNGEQVNKEHFRNQTPSNKVIILGLAQHITEADIHNDLIHYAIQPVSIRLIRKRKTGASRGFAFVEFSTEEEATRWMEYKQGVLMFQDQYRAIMQYSVSKESMNRDKVITDWYCAKCGVFNFKRRENCFKCNASREESEKGGEGSDEVSGILTKKIMLRNLDVLTNEEGVLTVLQQAIPDLVSKISKILICRDPLTSTSRGICYLSFDNLVDSMNTHNSLKALEPPLQIENREIIITYCIDVENRQINKHSGRNHHDSNYSNKSASSAGHQYTLADVPRLAEYSASVYAQTPAEHEYYYKYYTEYYTEQISNGMYSNLPTMSQLGETANSGAAVAYSCIQRKLKQQYGQSATAAAAASSPSAAVTTPASSTPIAPALQIPNGTDNKKYPTPDISQYQYDESSGYYYDPVTGLYYDSNSQYYYNSEIGQYLYWDAEKSTYILASSGQTDALTSSITDEPSTSTTTAPPQIIVEDTSEGSSAANSNIQAEDKKDKKVDQKHDKVKVAKKIVKDMEKWAKQLNQKKDMMQAIPAPAPAVKETVELISKPQSIYRNNMGGYADVGFSMIVENKERPKTTLELAAASSSTTSKLVSTYTSDSDNDQPDQQQSGEVNEKDYVDFGKLTCLLCKRAFQSSEILSKHLKMSNLHKENLQKYNLRPNGGDRNNGNSSSNNFGSNNSSLSYRDRAKERRQKYGESDPPPPNKSRERYEKELQRQTVHLQKQASSNLASTPIGENNVGNRLLQKMGWSEGQGLGRSNQGRTKIIEAESRASTAGLGTKTSGFAPGDDYKSYIKRMMKSRYEQAE